MTPDTRNVSRVETENEQVITISRLERAGQWLFDRVLSVPVRIKITGIVLLPVIVLGLSLNYWVTTGLSDWLSYLLTDDRVRAAMAAGGRSVLLVTFLAALGSVILAAVLTYIVTRPLLALREMAQRVAEGDLGSRARVWSRDEIGQVATSVNQMTDHLVKTQERLTRSNRRLSAINEVIQAAEREVEIHDVLYVVLRTTLDAVGLDMGWVYLRDPERERYHLASWHDVPPELQDALLQDQETNPCQCQQDLLAGDTLAETSIRHCQRLELASGLHLPSQHVTIPLEARGQKYGVINLLCPIEKTLSDDDMEILSAIGIEVSERVANAWLQLKLEEKEMARQLLLESLVEAQEDERSRLARELHDATGQMLTGLLVRLKTAERRATNGDLRNNLQAALETVAETIDHVRDLSYRLRPPALEEFGLAVALQTLVEDMAADDGLHTTCDLNIEGTMLPPGLEVTLYRIAQEGLTNVVRHAQATQVTVILHQRHNNVYLKIEDDGLGFAPQEVVPMEGRRNLGLISMRERAALAGGALEVYSAPGKGTSVEVRVPLMESVT